MKISLVDWNFVTISAILGLKYQIDPKFGHFFQQRHVGGAENPRWKSQNQNLTNEPHSVLHRTFQRAIGHQNRINIDEDSISFFI